RLSISLELMSIRSPRVRVLTRAQRSGPGTGPLFPQPCEFDLKVRNQEPCGLSASLIRQSLVVHHRTERAWCEYGGVTHVMVVQPRRSKKMAALGRAALSISV